jgi:hypothetical protein
LVRATSEVKFLLPHPPPDSPDSDTLANAEIVKVTAAPKKRPENLAIVDIRC